MRPVRDGPQRGAGGEDVGRFEERHQRHEPAVGAAVDADARAIDVRVFHEPLDAVEVIFELGRAHVAVDRGAPRAAVAGGAAIIHVDHDVAVLHEQLVKQKLVVVTRPALVRVLQIARAVDKHHRGFQRAAR